MVRTRGKAGGGDEGDDSEFLTFRSRPTIPSQKDNVDINGYASNESGPSFVESTVHRRRHRRTLVVETDSESDDTPPRRTTRRGYKEELHHDVEDEPVSRMRRSRRPPTRFIGEHHSSRGRIPLNGEIDGIRRSTRQKKLLYGTFDQKMIDKHLQIIGEADVEYHEEEKRLRRQKRSRSREVSGEQNAQGDGIDMYSRVKRPRRQVTRNMYGIPVDEGGDGDGVKDQPDMEDENGESGNEEDDEEEEEESSSSESEQPKSYYLREHRPRVTLYDAAPEVSCRRMKPKSVFSRDSPPRLRVRRTKEVYQSPARRSPTKFRKRKTAFHGSSSTSSSSSSDSSDDEGRFERRKAKSMAKSRSRCLPMNLSSEDVRGGIIRDRAKIGSSLADVDPMSVDRSVTFETVGGLGKHIRSLKEMIIFPLLYPEVFERFKITPPRGVLFYGPPGTGKTLVARALANECSHGDRKVAFFMRKGADCLSKWVGESERQLRLLFDQAFQMRPSIIFFDEIDGLAPVRSSRQDQIHSSIVSTLLALMDGLDNRGEIVVIGATNRIDSIDPALRRPGRFDREFHFPLPSVEARTQILQIHTRAWNPKPSEPFMQELAQQCVGYCGADLKALCTEACLHALRRRYPQIYNTSDKLELDVSSINIGAKDFQKGMQNIVPTAQRSLTSPGRALCVSVQPLLHAQLQGALRTLRSIFPAALAHLSSVDHMDDAEASGSTANNHSGNGDMDLYSDDDDTGPSIYDNPAQGRGRKKLHYQADTPKSFLSFSCSATDHPWTHRPRMLLSGRPHQGQSSHLAPAILHAMERLPVHVIDLPSLFAVSAKTPEESCSQVFQEARRTSPSIIYVPHVEELWRVVGDTLQATFLAMLNDMEPSCPVLLLATCDMPVFTLPDQVHAIFGAGQGEVVTMRNPTVQERRECFSDLLLVQAVKPPASRRQAAQRYLEILPKAKAPEPRKLTDKELKKLRQQEEQTLRELRIFLRDTLTKLGRERKFGIFTKPVDVEEVPDYYDIIKNPMDLSTMMSKVDLHKYNTVKEFLADIDLICSNALEYNPDKDPEDKAIRHRACALRDAANAIIEAELDKEFEKQCEEITASRDKRGEEPTVSVPSFYYTKPLQPTLGQGSSLSDGAGHYSIRSHSLTQDADLSQNNVPEEDEPSGPRTIVRRIRIGRAKTRTKLSPWCKPSRVTYRKVVIQIDEDGNEIWPEWYQRIQRKKEKKKDENSDEEEEEADKKENDEEKNEQDGEAEAKVEEKDEEKDEESVADEEESKPSTAAGSSPNKRSSPAAATVRKTSPRGRPEQKADDAVEGLQVPHNSRRRDRSTSPRVKPPQTEEDLGSPVINGEIYFKDRSPDDKPVEINTGVGTIPHRTRSRSSGRESDGESQASSRPVLSPKSHHSPSIKKSPASCNKDNPEDDQQENQNKSNEDTPMETDNVATAEETVTKEEQKTPASTAQPKECEEVQELTVRITRSQRRPQQVARATKILEEMPLPLVVDRERLKHLLEETVEATEGCTVEQIDKLYSVMNQCIYNHRLNADKTQMVQELENSISKYCAGDGR